VGDDDRGRTGGDLHALPSGIVVPLVGAQRLAGDKRGRGGILPAAEIGPATGIFRQQRAQRPDDAWAARGGARLQLVTGVRARDRVTARITDEERVGADVVVPGGFAGLHAGDRRRRRGLGAVYIRGARAVHQVVVDLDVGRGGR